MISYTAVSTSCLGVRRINCTAITGVALGIVYGTQRKGSIICGAEASLRRAELEGVWLKSSAGWLKRCGHAGPWAMVSGYPLQSPFPISSHQRQRAAKSSEDVRVRWLILGCGRCCGVHKLDCCCRDAKSHWKPLESRKIQTNSEAPTHDCWIGSSRIAARGGEGRGGRKECKDAKAQI